ncbi:hypothetical protein NEF87_001929 [Candidatus Lokiarchaeum ossiferum]|uniref:Uncharacterized protein n=1 Tax=Candidatus Lokiarchaeum ossiferum TaxID=2951803 RepID=A0ABY6HT47_9ARCH|nr:hypothetical protein NEF87_001929 [Candidatus Lokiarchaeum sp. B-35]
MVSPKKTTVVGIKLMEQEFFLWDLLRNEYQKSFSEIITSTVARYLELKMATPITDSGLIFKLKQLFEKVKFKKESRTLTFRIKSTVLKEWDRFCEQRFISRTALVKQAMNGRIDPVIGRFLKYSDPYIIRLQKILNNMISRIGLMEYEDIAAIFEGIDRTVLNHMLNTLEEKGIIGRKGWNTYVPANSTAGMTDALLIAGNLGRFVESMNEVSDDFEMSDHDSLLNVVFQYFEAIFARKGTTQFNFDVQNLRETKERMIELLK